MALCCNERVCSPIRRLGGGYELVDEGMDVQPDRVGYVEEFDNVDTAAAAFERGDDGLVSAESIRQLRLAQTCALALFDKNIDETHLSR